MSNGGTHANRPPRVTRGTPASAQFTTRFSLAYPRLAKFMIVSEIINTIFSYIASLSCIIFGAIMIFRGITGQISWTAKYGGLESGLTDAGPGVVLVIVGLFLALMARPNIKITD